MKVLVIGGVAAGASAATRLRRMDESAEIIMLEQGSYVSFANCGLPYYVGGDIPDRDDLLLVSPELFRTRFRIDVRLHSLVSAINREKKTVTVHAEGKVFEESYDKLVLAPGCRPVVPPIKGVELENISTVFTIDDVDRIMTALEGQVSSAIVVGGGFIGIETAEALLKRGIKTTMVEMREQLMPIFDPEFSLPMEAHLKNAGIDLRMETSVTAFEGDGKVAAAILSDGSRVEAQLVIMAAGLRPRTELAAKAGLEIGVTGGIVVNDCMQTSDPDIYAAGDAVESFHRVSGKPIRVSLATNANLQGRIAGDHIAGGKLRYQGTLATSIIRVCDITAAVAGLSEAEAKAAGFDCFSAFVPEGSNAGYYPGAGWMILKITAEKGSGRILGAQGVGEKGVDKRIDVLATAIYGGMTAYDLENMNLCYAPPYSSAKGPEIIGGMILSNALRGETQLVTPDQLHKFLEETGAELIDLREPGELESEGGIPGGRLIPLHTLRANPELLEKGKKYVFSCGVGKRAHTACRFMAQLGYDVWNLTGGYNAYTMDV